MNEIIGKTATDSLTGFTGVILARCEYITGCNQLLVQPKVDDKGAYVESRWIDEPRCDVLAAVPRVAVRGVEASPGFDKPAPRR